MHKNYYWDLKIQTTQVEEGNVGKAHIPGVGEDFTSNPEGMEEKLIYSHTLKTFT